MNEKDIPGVIKTLQEESVKYNQPTSQSEAGNRDPFRVLAGVLLSSRTRDDTTGPAADRLFDAAPTPEEIAAMDTKGIEELIYPVGFYHTKARHLKKTARMLVDEFSSRVPRNMDDLLKLPGIGRKSANLVLGVAFGIPSICVDTHVHRITNRWGYVKTSEPYHTEMALRKKLPKKYWLKINRLLVIYGQKVCTPQSPRCSECRIEKFCEQVGIKRAR